MDRPRSSKYDNPITLNVAVMFLFYILSISLCLSSISTCICVIFNPVGFFRTIANYILYALGLSIFLTFLFVGRLGYDFDDLTSHESTSSESTEILNVIEDKGSASQEAVDTAPIQERHHEMLGPQEMSDVLPIHEEQREGSAPQEVVQRTRVPSPPTPSHTVIKTPLSTPGASNNSLPKLPTETANTTDGNPHFREESFASPEDASYVAEQMENLPKTHAETIGQQNATANVITARESKKIEKWIDQTDVANNHAAKALHGMQNGDDTNHQDLNEDTSEITVKRRSNNTPLSEPQSVGQDSDFQKALRGFMTKGQKRNIRQEGSTVSMPSVGLSRESEFQGVVRRMFMLEKGERKGKALSV
ncbi:hypothetical protein BDR22DRAFT_895654 [Usnea florida]